MKLLNYTSSYFSVILLVIIPIWAGLFYFAMLDEIYDSMDDGLGNQKLLIISKASSDPLILYKKDFDEGNYSINPIPFEHAKNHKDTYLDTMMYMHNENDFEPVRMLKTVFADGNQYYFMKVITSMVEEDDLIKELLYSLLWLYLGLVFTILLLNNLLLKKIWKPFNRLIDQVSKFRLEDAKPLITNKTKIDEFNTLNHTIDTLLQTNIVAYTNQKQLIENASHELQTPLAITMNKLEILAEEGQLTDHQAQLVSSALDNLTRLQRLNQSLLLLSKIENKQFPETSSVNINQLFHRVLEDFSAQIVFHRLTVRLDEHAECNWQMHPDLADIMASNLIRNAISHNYPGGNITILIESDLLVIKNSGKNFGLDNQNIFKRFYKGQSSNSTGIGLAIVKAVVELYNFTISYEFNTEHVFIIRK
ncbi:MAG TPA: HAMP domain-containing sensor histidine kinase [Sphingobacteriaceae bacterium]